MTQPWSIADGRYLLVQQLGEGGMATVYRAFDQRLQVWRAIKILAPQYSNRPKLRARFETEAQTMALLEHRHIVRVYDVGSEGQLAYIVMELVEGGSLVDWLERNGPMPPRLATEVTIEICEGIYAAHAKGVIHRDIKPHNVLITREGTCRVTDFGIARVGDGDQSMTKTGAVMGTWGYMAPEQRTDAKTVDERADVYAVAATLYTLLTNRMPMDLFAADRDQTMMQGIPEDLEQVLIRATEYRREDRYGSVTEFSEVLADLLPSLPPLPVDMPPLAGDPGDPLPPPSAEVLAAVQPLNPRATGERFGTILPEDGVQPEPSQTLTPGTTSWTSGTPAPPRQTGPGFAINPSLESYPADASLHGLTPVAPQRRRRSKKRGALVWIAVALPALLGVFLIAVALAIVGTQIVTSSARGVSPDDDVLTANDPSGDDDANPDGTSTNPDTEQPTSGVDTPPTEVASTTTSPAVRDPGVAPTTVRDPGTKSPGTKPPGTKPPVTSPQVTTPKNPPGTGDHTSTTPAGTATSPATTTSPPARQCLNITPPNTITVGDRAQFVAKLCQPRETAEVTLYYRAAGTGEWQSQRMPYRLKAYRAVVSVDDRFAMGMEYYVVGDGVHEATAAQPKLVPAL